MELYLMQHGEAAPEEQDPDRPLTGRGRSDVTRVASRARSAGVVIGTILHSGKRRAEESAGILAAELGGAAVTQHDGLAPNDPVVPVSDWLRQQAQEASIAIVGHQPFLGRLVAHLVAEDEAAQVIDFRMGGLVALVPKRDRPGFTLSWALTPELA